VVFLIYVETRPKIAKRTTLFVLSLDNEEIWTDQQLEKETHSLVVALASLSSTTQKREVKVKGGDHSSYLHMAASTFKLLCNIELGEVDAGDEATLKPKLKSHFLDDFQDSLFRFLIEHLCEHADPKNKNSLQHLMIAEGNSIAEALQPILKREKNRMRFPSPNPNFFPEKKY